MLGFKTLAFLREWLGTPNKHENNNSGWRHPWIREQILFSGSYSQAWLARRMRMVGWSVIMEDFFSERDCGEFRDYALSQDLLKGFQEPRVYCSSDPVKQCNKQWGWEWRSTPERCHCQKFTAVAKNNLNQSANLLLPCSLLSPLFFSKRLHFFQKTTFLEAATCMCVWQAHSGFRMTSLCFS